MDAFVARQAIFDRRKNVFAYELLFRNGIGNYMPKIDGDVATSTLLSNSYLTIGIDKLTAGKPGFVNFTQNLIEKELPLLFPKDFTVVEILEDVRPDPAVLAACTKFSRMGYRLALDDYVLNGADMPLVELADIIKIDLRKTSMEQAFSLIHRFEDKNIRFIAEKVETHQEYLSAVEIGFDYFQGYFFCRPEIFHSKEITGSQLIMLQVIAEISKPDYDLDAMENLLRQDLSISYKLLRYINSAFFRRIQEITSLKHAILLLGCEEMRRFISLVALSKLAPKKPDELIRSSCIKARFCESLGILAGKADLKNDLFLAGMFSNIDAVLDQPLQKILEELPFSMNIKDALLHQEGSLAGMLALADRYIKGEWGQFRNWAEKLQVPEEKIPPLYADACLRADAMTF